jgi:hypothetical protein
MAIPSRQIGWGTEENLLWQISKQLEYLTGVAYAAGSASSSTTTFPVPGFGDTVSTTAGAGTTIINFEGPIANDFTLDVTTAPGAQLGSKIYLMITGGNPSGEITFAGDLNNIECGSPYNAYTPENDIRNVIEFIYDGLVWTGIDNC